MNTMRCLTSIAATLILLVPHLLAQDEHVASYTLIKNINIFDGVNDTLTPGSVLIESNLIKRVGAKVEAPDGATIIDGGGRTLMPGLINSHVHLALPDSIPPTRVRYLWLPIFQHRNRMGLPLLSRGIRLLDGSIT